MVTMWRSDIYHLLPIWDLYTKVRIKFLASGCLLPCILQLFFTLYIKIKVNIVTGNNKHPQIWINLLHRSNRTGTDKGYIWRTFCTTECYSLNNIIHGINFADWFTFSFCSLFFLPSLCVGGTVDIGWGMACGNWP